MCWLLSGVFFHVAVFCCFFWGCCSCLYQLLTLFHGFSIMEMYSDGVPGSTISRYEGIMQHWSMIQMKDGFPMRLLDKCRQWDAVLSAFVCSSNVCVHFNKRLMGPGAMAQWLRSSPCTPGIPYGRQFYPGSPASLSAPCLWPGKAVEDSPELWDPVPRWETRKRLLASDRHSMGRCAPLGSESSDGRSSSLSLLSVYLPFQWKNNKNESKKKIVGLLDL